MERRPRPQDGRGRPPETRDVSVKKDRPREDTELYVWCLTHIVDPRLKTLIGGFPKSVLTRGSVGVIYLSRRTLGEVLVVGQRTRTAEVLLVGQSGQELGWASTVQYLQEPKSSVSGESKVYGRVSTNKAYVHQPGG